MAFSCWPIPLTLFMACEAARIYVPDWLPCLVNSVRIFVTIGAVELFWVATAWPSGAQAITFAAIYVFLLTLQGDRVHSTATDFLIGVCLTAAVAAIVKFAVLPGVDTFAGLSLAIGLVLVPAGAVIALPWRPAIFTFVILFIEPLVAPENQMTYDTQQFYNLALAIVVGLGSAALAFHLLPPLSPELRTRRLLALTLRDLRRLTKRPAAWTANDVEEPHLQASMRSAGAGGAAAARTTAGDPFDGDGDHPSSSHGSPVPSAGRTRCDAASDGARRRVGCDRAAWPDSTACWPAFLAPRRERGPGCGRAPASLRCRRPLAHPAYFDAGAAL